MPRRKLHPDISLVRISSRVSVQVYAYLLEMVNSGR